MNIPALQKTRSGRLVLDLPPLTLREGEICAVLGANGAGKTTFARLLAGVLRPDGGGAVLPGVAVRYLPQKSYAFRMSVGRNLRLGGRGDEAAVLARFGLLPLRRQNAKKLSGGETARLALARVMMEDCELLILDEPTAAMDLQATVCAEAEIRACCERTGCAVLLITHAIRQAERLADRVLILNGGTLAEDGPAAEVLSRPATEAARKFLEYGAR